MTTPLLPAFTGAPDLNRVYHCDALTLLRALPDESVDLIVTDPPYGVGTQVSARRLPALRFGEIIGADSINDTWLVDAYRVLRDGAAAYIFAKWVNMGDWKTAIESAGFAVKNCIIWDKMQHGTGDLQGAYGPQYEMILFAVKGRHVLRGIRQTDIIRYPKVQPNHLTHPYQKPVGLLQKLIRASTDRGDVVIDCFSGSGVTGEAARLEHRDFILSDLDTNYATIARRRLEQPYTPDMFALAELQANGD